MICYCFMTFFLLLFCIEILNMFSKYTTYMFEHFIHTHSHTHIHRYINIVHAYVCTFFMVQNNWLAKKKKKVSDQQQLTAEKKFFFFLLTYNIMLLPSSWNKILTSSKQPGEKELNIMLTMCTEHCSIGWQQQINEAEGKPKQHTAIKSNQTKKKKHFLIFFFVH